MSKLSYLHKLSGEKPPGRYEVVKVRTNGCFTTSPGDLEKGMCVCSDCGTLCSTDYKWCSHCKDHVLIITEKVAINRESSIKYKNQKNENKH